METVKFRPLKPSEVELRVGRLKGNGASYLLYKDARVDMRLLDENFGVYGWQREHKEVKGVAYCGVSIKSPNGEWITKWDAGSESNTEKEKGEASDSFKRACFNWGIGRELYTAPFIWINLTEKEVQNKGNIDVKVSRMTVEDGEITAIEIVDSNGKVRFSQGFGAAPTNTTQPAAQPAQPAQPTKEMEIVKLLADANACKTADEVMAIYNAHKDLWSNPKFKDPIIAIGKAKREAEAAKKGGAA
jgi:hypothetical protein